LLIVIVCLLVIVPVGLSFLIQKRAPAFSTLLLVLGLTPLFALSFLYRNCSRS
jgi:hypothetical protein